MNDPGVAEFDGLLKAWGKAIVSNDAEAIGRFAADDWLIVGGTGVATKQQFLDAVSSGALTHDSFEIEATQVRTYGDVATVIARVRNTGAFQGAAFTSDEWTTDVYVKQDGAWLCALTALTAVTNP
jgi:ketosteroid isomerase-like protein